MTVETLLNETQISNDGAEPISFEEPYVVEITVSGVCPIIFHRWSVEGVEEKSNAAKGSKAKKTDNIESYIWRNEKQEVCIPGEYLRQSMIHAAKYKQDPRSPRKSAMDLVKAGLVSLTELAPITSAGATKPGKNWDYEDKRHVVVQRAGITRVRPAFKEGWKATFYLQVILPEYIDKNFLHEILTNAGRLTGLADFRPTYGRFNVVSFQVK